MNKINIVVIGGGGHAKSIISIIKELPNYNIKGYLDQKNQGDILNIKYLGNDNELVNIIRMNIAKAATIGIGNQGNIAIIKNLCKKMLSMGYFFPSIIAKSAVVSKDVSIGQGTIIMHGAIVNTGTQICNFSVVNTKASIDHDCIIKNFVHIAPGTTVCGNVTINDDSFVGAGTTIINNITVNSNCIIGSF